jgi:hypothetical protein
MINTFQRFTVATAGLALSLTTVGINLAQATTTTYDFEVFLDSGSLVSQTYSGFFSYDDSGLMGTGEEFLEVSAIKFNFLGLEFSEANNYSLFAPEVAFFKGDFLGLSFSSDFAANNSFSFIPGFFSLEEAFFAYDIEQGAGAGDVTYSLRPSTSVPEPSAIFGLSLLGIGWLLKKQIGGKLLGS